MDVRMLPIRHVFERFPRLVRDLAHQQGKQIELVLQGEETRVDKAVIDELGEPLVHLIRNAVDHGIEAAGRAPPARQVRDRHAAALGRPGVEPGRDHADRRRQRDRRRLGAQEGGRARPAGGGRGALRPRGDPADLHRGLLDREHGHRRLRARRRARRGGEEHGAAQRPDRGRDDPRRGHQVHAPAAAHARDHHGADGGRGRRGLRAALGRGGREPALREARPGAHERARHAARARPHRAVRPPRGAVRPQRVGRRRSRLRGDHRPRRQAARPVRRPPARAAGRRDQGARCGRLERPGRHRRGHDPRRRTGGADPGRGDALRGAARARRAAAAWRRRPEAARCTSSTGVCARSRSARRPTRATCS